ncbi:MAG TPA: dihydrodipicolinate synthase family protein [Devosiaceae bacterium]
MTLDLVARAATTFNAAGAVDEGLQRQFLQRFIDARLGVFMGSGGSGEGHALDRDELRRVYLAGVAACKGKVRVWANPPEQYSAKLTIEHSLLAAECGVEVVNIYALAGLHSMRPLPYELKAYYEEVLSAVNFPVALAAQPLVGYSVPPELIADLCRRFPQIVALNLTGVPDGYFFKLRELMTTDVEYFVPIAWAPHALHHGATGLLGTESNIIPQTYRHYLDALERNDLDEAARTYGLIRRFLDYVAPWNSGPTRWIKMCMRVLKLPGGEGGVREPYRLPPDDQLHSFATGLTRLGVPEIDAMAKAAGLM